MFRAATLLALIASPLFFTSLTQAQLNVANIPTDCLVPCVQILPALDCIAPLQNSTNASDAELQSQSTTAAQCLCPQIAPSDQTAAAAVKSCQTCLQAEAANKTGSASGETFSTYFTSLSNACASNDTATAATIIAGLAKSAGTANSTATIPTVTSTRASTTPPATATAASTQNGAGSVRASSAAGLFLVIAGGVLMV
ncbi:hypothetical protein HDV00_002820 [Rhizophlyctis rosea]|nr:hypothetical protein HDV00_002820 [Rhizophlyctis rosea]